MTTDPKTPSKPIKDTPWSYLLMVVLLGPLPVTIVSILTFARALTPENAGIAVCGSCCGLWGMTMGWKSHQLARAIAGLNGGALLGSLAGWFLQLSWRYKDPNSIPSVVPAYFFLCVSVGVLRGLVWIEPTDRWNNFRYNFFKGFWAMVSLAIIFLMVFVYASMVVKTQGVAFMLAGVVSSAVGVSILFLDMPVLTKDE